MNPLSNQSLQAQFSGIVNSVLDSASEILGDLGTETNFTALELAQNELARLRTELQRPSREHLGGKMVENDYLALLGHIEKNPFLRLTDRDVKVGGSGRVVSIAHYGGDIDSLSALEILTALECLYFHHCRRADFSALSQVLQLKSLSICSNWDLDMETFLAMPLLESFNGNHSNITDLSWISGCTTLRDLQVIHTNLASLEGLRNNDSLEFIGLSHTLIRSLEPLTGHSKIQRLFLDHTKITDLSPILSIPTIRELRISEDMTSLSSFPECSQYLAEIGSELIIVD